MAVVFQVRFAIFFTTRSLFIILHSAWQVVLVLLQVWVSIFDDVMSPRNSFSAICADLATHCRMLLYNRPNHTKAYRWCCLYPLYVLSEVAIISTDLAELLGSATAFVILFPSLPLWAGVLLTASDVFLILAFSDPTRGRPARLFEGIIAILVLSVFVSLIYVIVRVGPKWGDAFDGFIPSKNIFKPGGLYTCESISGHQPFSSIC